MNPAQFSPQEIDENHRQLQQQELRFAEYGYAPQASVDFALRHALPLRVPCLEFATGKGRFLCSLAGRVGRITTVELDPAEQRIAMLNAAHAGVLGRIEFVLANGLRLPWPDRLFASAVSMNTMHHVDDVAGVMGELVRVVSPQGRIVISDFNEEGFAIMDRIHAADGKVHPRSSYRPPDIVAFLAGSGWQADVHHGALQTVIVAQRSIVPTS